MAMQGNLQSMSVADLIQHNCQDYKTAQLIIKHKRRQAVLFFDDGAVKHATLGKTQGEEVVYTVLGWQDGKFTLKMNVDAPTVSINRSWSGLLLEGARRLDESQIEDKSKSNIIYKEENQMAQKLETILEDLREQVGGFIATAVVGMDGFGIAQQTNSDKMNVDTVNAQMTLFIKLVGSSVSKLGVGEVEDNLLTTEKAYLLIRFLEDKPYYLGIMADRKTGKLGNMRLASRVYAQRISDAILS